MSEPTLDLVPTVVRAEDTEILRESAAAERRQAVRYAGRRYVAIPRLSIEVAGQYSDLAMRIGALGMEEGADEERVLDLSFEEAAVLDSARAEAVRRQERANSWLGRLQQFFAR